MIAKIGRKFGPTVLRLVEYCTTPEKSGLSYNAHKRAYLENIALGPATALLIAGSDKLHNLSVTLRDALIIGEKAFSGFSKRSPEEKLQYYRDVVRIFGATGHYPNLVRVLAHTLEQVESRL